MDTNWTGPVMWEPSLTDQLVVTLIFASIILVGIVGNLLVITIIILAKKMHSALNMCLASLAIADLIVVVFLPIIPWNLLYGSDDSVLGKNFCIFVSSIDRGAVVCSVLTFLLIAVERYTVLCHPLKTLGTWTYKKVSVILAAIWGVSAGVCIPYGCITTYETVEHDNKTVTLCRPAWETPWLKTYETFLLVIGLTVPLCVIILLYAKMIIALKTKVRPGLAENNREGTKSRTSHKRIILLLCVLIAVFVVCLLPSKILLLLDSQLLEVMAMDGQSLFALIWFSRIVLYVNHSINPVAYFLMSGGFRDGFKDVFCKKCRCKEDVFDATVTTPGQQ